MSLSLPLILMTMTPATLIFLLSTHLTLMWAALELNTLTVLYLIANKSHPRAIEATIKYFITQALASALMIFSGALNYEMTGSWKITEMTNPIALTTLTLALSIKLGLVPFHFWVPEVLQGMPTLPSIFLLTWQKLGPLVMFFQTAPLINHNLISSMAILSSIVAGWLGINQAQVRKLVALSSIAQMAWMVIIIKYAPSLAVLTFYIYSVAVSAALITLDKLSVTTMKSLTISFSKNPTSTLLLMASVLSLSGLPPLAGFTPKWLTISQLIAEKAIWTSFIMLTSTLLTLFFYVRLWYSSISTMSPNTANMTRLWRKTPNQGSFPASTLATAASILLLCTVFMKAISKDYFIF
uniref:NADH-ubiquinone oxidoreductase chain 2 n=1 Tax=Caiman crocodilus TaxID=8499 RepID=Q9B214_CAICR|nr:NADH dehydrogenase subunit 2 [Caiman crocodilus]CAC36944.1 NADH dehydrogenase subunit 2 [Caiman crocodilus]